MLVRFYFKKVTLNEGAGIYHPHLESPQLLHFKQPSSKIKPSGSLQFAHFLSKASVPSGTKRFNALATPFFQVLM